MRATMGVMLVRLDEGAHVVGFDRVDEGGQTGSRMDDLEDDDDAPESTAAPLESAPAEAGSEKLNPPMFTILELRERIKTI